MKDLKNMWRGLYVDINFLEMMEHLLHQLHIGLSCYEESYL